MRVYYFSAENGIYQGEGFLDKRDLTIVEGATAIPPPSYSPSEVPIFNATTQSWTLHAKNSISLGKASSA